MKLVNQVGNYFLFIKRVFATPLRFDYFFNLVIKEIYNIGMNSIGIVCFISIFMGAVVSVQMAKNFQSASIPVPDIYIGHATKVVVILEFAPTIMSLILAGKIGSYICSSIGSMRVTEQIDALDVMGINSANFLILPKIIACLLFNPLLIMLSIIFSIIGGYFIGLYINMWSPKDFINGLKIYMPMRMYIYCFSKTILFSFIMSSLPGYYGYNVKGNTLNVGRASTTAVVNTSIIIIFINLILTNLILV